MNTEQLQMVYNFVLIVVWFSMCGAFVAAFIGLE